MDGSPHNVWLMKAEPESRIVKGQDVSFSIADLEKLEVEHWDGVRNHEAKNLMKEKMKKGDHVLFYHSNCKTPGIAGIAEIHREGYPDFTAFDASHPYFDPKSVESKPTWFMVDVKFISRLPHFVPLKLLQDLVNSKVQPPEYLLPDDLKAIKEMALLNRGRLSVQPVSSKAFQAIKSLGFKGGWSNLDKVGSSKPNALKSEISRASAKDTEISKRKSAFDGADRGRRKRAKK